MKKNIRKINHTALGAFSHRIKAKKGPLIAIKVTARKIAVLYYNVMTKGIDFVEKGITDYRQKVKEQKLKYLQKQAKPVQRSFLKALLGSSDLIYCQ